MASPREQANVALFLASDEASFVVGSTFLADGGFTASI
jgi:NAD(P)-dependent dehydrogenase (short-subunit alcohol dehydrogenase family)